MKKNLALIFIINFIFSNIFATNYYVSPSGNDANPGTLALPWRTMAPVNAIQATINNGEHSVLFERGGIYRGAITMNAGGANPSQRLTYGAYGTGAKPKLLGSTTLGGWTNMGGDVWRMNPGQLIGELFMNDKRQTLARYPNMSYLAIDNFSGNSLTQASLSSGSWNGAKVVIRRQNDWIIQGDVTSQSGNTIDINMPNGGGQINAGKGFFVAGVASAMDLTGEWYQDKSAPYYIYIKMPTNPNTQQFEGSILDNAFSGGYKYNIIWENIDVRYYKKRAITIGNCGSITIQNCNFKNIGERGIFLQGDASGNPATNGTENILIDSCTFYDINSEAMMIEWFKNSTISRNYAKRIGINAGYEVDNLNSAIGFYIHHIYNVNINSNRIDSTGYSCMVWNGEANTIEKNEMSNNGLTKNDNGFIQAWGGKTRLNLIKDNILHDGFGSEDGIPGHDWTKNSIGSAEGIYFDSFTFGNTITGNTIYNSKNGLFVQSSQNFTISNNTTYNCYWNGLMHHEFNPTGSQDPCAHDCSWSADIVNTKTFNNIFYSVRPDQNGIRWSSDRCNSPFNFGTSDNNYIFNPYSPTKFRLYYETCPGNPGAIGQPFTISQWRTARNKELSSITNSFNWAPYTYSTTGSNLISNGTFNSDINGWFGNGSGTAIWESNPLLTAGTFKATQTGGAANGYEIQSPNIAIQAGKQYLVSFSVVANRNSEIKPQVKSKHPDYTFAYSPENFQVSTTPADYQFVFTAPNPLSGGASYGLHFFTQANGDIVWLDNISIFEVTSITPDAFLDRSKLFVNNQTAPQNFSLGTNVYKDLDGNFVCGNITVQPYKSRILILQDGFVSSNSVLGNNLAICSGQKAVLTITGASSGIQWQQSANNSTWTSITGATMAIYTTAGLAANTYFRVAVTTTACGSSVNITNSILVSVTGASSPMITASKNPICIGENVVMTLSGAVGALVWRGAPTTAAIWSDAPGINNTYIYTATGLTVDRRFNVSINGACGIINSPDYAITVNPNVNTDISYPWPTCNNVQLDLPFTALKTESIGFYSSTTVGILLNSVTGTLDPSTVTGNVHIKYTKYAANGCATLTSVTSINLFAAPTVGFLPGLTYCANIPFSITATGGNVYTWAINGFPQSYMTDLKTVAGIYTYNVRATSSIGCVKNSTLAVVTILGNPLPTITGAPNLSYCQFTSPPVSDITNKVSGSSLRWYNVSVSGPFTNSPGVPGTGIAGTPAYSIWVSNFNGACESPRLKFDININPTSISNINPVGVADICSGNNVVLTSTSAINNQWYRNGQTISGANTKFLTVTAAGIYNLKVGSGLCSDTISVGTKVSVTPLPNINLSISPSSQSVCTGAGASFSIANSEAGVVYEAFRGANSLNTTVMGTGSTVLLSITSSNLTLGGNNITIKATGFASNGTGANSILASSAPIIDGNLTESGWNISKNISKCVNDVCPGNNTATFGTQWDANYLYVGVKVVDNTVLFDPTKNFWDTDAIEIFVDGDRARAGTGDYDVNDKQYILRYGDPNHVVLEKSTWIPVTVSGSGVIFESKLTNDGFTMEVAIPWSRIGIPSPSVGSSIGFDVGYDDNDGGINRYSQVVYAGYNNNAWDNRQWADLAMIGSQNFCSGTVNLTTTAAITVNTSPVNPVFNYGNNKLCNNLGLINIATFSGTGGGTYSATGGLTINSITGAISVTGFAANVYTINYNASAGCGTVSGSTMVTVTSAPNIPNFNYGSNPYCSNQNTIFITTIAGILGGIFSATNGFSVNSLGNITVNSLAGISTITYTVPANNGCGSVSGTATVTINSAPIIPSFNYGTLPYCSNQNTISITTIAGVTGGSFSATNGFNVNGFGNIIVNSLAGISTVTYTKPAANGCGSVSGTATVTVNSAPIIPNFNYGNLPYCSNQNTISITTIAGILGGIFSATNGFSVNSLGNITVNSLAGISTITYTVPANNGCGSVSGMATITTVGFAIGGTITGGNNSVTINGNSGSMSIVGNTGSITGWERNINNNGWNVIASTSNTNSFNENVSNIGITEYRVAVSNGICGTSYSTVKAITVLGIGGFVTGTINQVCENTNIQNLTLVGGIGTKTWMYSFNGGTYTPIANNSDVLASFAPSSVGIYSFAVSILGTGLSSAYTVAVNSEPIIPNFNYGNNPYCSNQNTISVNTVAGISGGSFSATNGFSVNSFGNIIVNSLAGISTVTYTKPAAKGCGSVSGTATVTVNSAPIIPNFNYGNLPYCSNQNTISITTIAGISGGSFSATNGFNVNGFGNIIVNSLAGISTITYTVPANNGCGSVSGMATVTVNSAPIIPSFNYGTLPYCSNQNTISITTLVGISGGSFSATNGFSVNSLGNITVNSLAGISTITYTVPSNNGCGSVSGTASVTVSSAPNIPSFNYGSNPYCSNQNTISVNTVAGISGGSFTATNGFSINGLGNIIVNSLAGISTITYTVPANNGCGSVSGMATVTVNGLNATPSLIYQGSVCQSINSLSPLSPTIANAIFSYSTSGTNILNINTATGAINPSLSSIGGYNIIVNVASQNACPSVSTITSLVINADDIATFSYPSATICNLTGGSILPNIVGQTTGGTYTYSTSGSNILSINNLSGEIIPSVSGVGNYVINYQTTGICSKSATFTMTVGTNPLTADFSFTNATFCANDANPQANGTIQTLSVVSSTGTGNLVWADQTQGIVNLASSGVDQTYHIKNVVSIAGCGTDTKFADITINANPNVSISGSASSVCLGNSVTLTGLGTTDYVWLPNNAITNKLTLTPTNTNTVTLTGTTNNCSSKAIFTVTVNALPILSINTNPANKTICQGESVTLSGNGALYYVWSGNINDNISFVPTISGTYSVTGTDVNNCKAIKTENVIVNNRPNAPIGDNSIIACVGNSPNFSVLGINLKWYDAIDDLSGNSIPPTITSANPTTTTAFVTQTDANNCESVDKLEQSIIVKTIPKINIISNRDEICFQNAFTINSLTTATGLVSNYKWFVNNVLEGTNTQLFTDSDFNLPVGINAIKLIATPTETCGNITTIASDVIIVTVTSRPTQPSFDVLNTTVCSDIGSITWINTSNLSTSTWLISPTNSGVNANSNGITVANNAIGFYQITAVNRLGSCPNINSTFAGIYINPKPILPSGLTYNSPQVCGDRNLQLDLINTTILSGFSTSVAGININANGSINFPNSVIGPVLVNYSISVAGCNPISTTINLTIDKPIVLNSITYTKPKFCKEGLESVSINGENTGSFYSSNGLSLNVNNGDINLANSTKGSYQVIYTISGNGACAGKSAQTTLEILEPSALTITADNFTSQGICEQNTISLTLANHQNDILTWMKKTESNTTWINTENFSTNINRFTSEKLSEKTTYAAMGTLTACPNLSKTSNEIEVNVDLISRVGKATVTDAIPEDANAEICPDMPTTEITLEESRGTIQWYESFKKDTSFYLSINANAVLSANTKVLNTPNDIQFNHVKYYKASVKNGVCPAVFSNIVEVRTCKRSDFIPNALTPFGNDKNATWDLSALKLNDNAILLIFNRYGSTILEKTGKEIRTNPWDGDGLPAGTYYYSIDRRDGSKVLTGDITIVK